MCVGGERGGEEAGQAHNFTARVNRRLLITSNMRNHSDPLVRSFPQLPPDLVAAQPRLLITALGPADELTLAHDDLLLSAPPHACSRDEKGWGGETGDPSRHRMDEDRGDEGFCQGRGGGCGSVAKSNVLRDCLGPCPAPCVTGNSHWIHTGLCATHLFSPPCTATGQRCSTP